jgi:hypothetical protein
MICLFIGIAVYIIALSTLNTGARYFAMMFTAISNGQCGLLSSPGLCLWLCPGLSGSDVPSYQFLDLSKLHTLFTLSVLFALFTLSARTWYPAIWEITSTWRWSFSLIRHSRTPVVPLQHHVTAHRPTLSQARSRTRSHERYRGHVQRVGQLRVGLGSEASLSGFAADWALLTFGTLFTLHPLHSPVSSTCSHRVTLHASRSLTIVTRVDPSPNRPLSVLLTLHDTRWSRSMIQVLRRLRNR